MIEWRGSDQSVGKEGGGRVQAVASRDSFLLSRSPLRYRPRAGAAQQRVRHKKEQKESQSRRERLAHEICSSRHCLTVCLFVCLFVCLRVCFRSLPRGRNEPTSTWRQKPLESAGAHPARRRDARGQHQSIDDDDDDDDDVDGVASRCRRRAGASARERGSVLRCGDRNADALASREADAKANDAARPTSLCAEIDSPWRCFLPSPLWHDLHATSKRRRRLRGCTHWCTKMPPTRWHNRSMSDSVDTATFDDPTDWRLMNRLEPHEELHLASDRIASASPSAGRFGGWRGSAHRSSGLDAPDASRDAGRRTRRRWAVPWSRPVERRGAGLRLGHWRRCSTRSKPVQLTLMSLYCITSSLFVPASSHILLNHTGKRTGYQFFQSTSPVTIT